MNTQPPPSPYQPLTDEEQALARIARALPSSDPPAALDARILAAGRAALHAPTASRRRPWFASLLGLGTAAAAVLAVGVAWQLRHAPDPAAPQQARGVAHDAVPVELLHVLREPPQIGTTPPPPAAPRAAPAAPQAPRAVAASPAAPDSADDAAALRLSDHLDEALSMQAPGPAAAPAPAPAATGTDDLDAAAPGRAASLQERTVLGAAAADAGADAGAAGRKDQAAHDPLTGQAGDGTNASAASRTRDGAARSEMSAQAERRSADAARAAQAQAAARFPSAQADRGLAPDVWLQRIRARRDGGDLAGARASLRLFKRSHPQRRVPEDLGYLLRE